jgi:hypothetical protein
MTANEERREGGWQEDKKKYWPLDGYRSFTSWDDVLESFDPNKIGMEATMGILHAMAQAPDFVMAGDLTASPETSFRRLAFYLHCAEYGGEGLSAIHGGFVPEYYLRSMAYKCLLGSRGPMLYHDILKRIDNPSVVARDHKTYRDFMELLKATLDFFSRPFNRPVQPEHKKNLASFLGEILDLKRDSQLFSVGEPFLAPDYTELDKDAAEIREKAIKAVVNCRLYGLIVEKKLFEAMDPLLEMVLQEERTGFPLFVFSCLNSSTGDIKKNVLATIFQLKLKGDSAANTWIVLWAMKNTPEEETLFHQPQGQMKPRLA